jgi:predicted RNA binding protein YcfA (HicA-like mRNA interferase family)
VCAADRGTARRVKRTDLIRAIEEMGCVLIRHGGRHDWYQNPEKGIPARPAAPGDSGEPGEAHRPHARWSATL